MAKKDLETVIGRIVTDKEFRKTLKKDPEKALKKYNLSKNEAQMLCSLNFDEKTKEAVKLLDKRISKFKFGIPRGIVLEKAGDISVNVAKTEKKLFDKWVQYIQS